jgi:hypothetical protein
VLGEPTTLWVVSRPHNWRDAPDPREWLLHLHLESGRELGRVQARRGCSRAPAGCSRTVRACFASPCIPHPPTLHPLPHPQIPSRWAHDAVRRRDRVYVASTGDGRVLELALANMTLVGGGWRPGGPLSLKAARSWGTHTLLPRLPCRPQALAALPHSCARRVSCRCSRCTSTSIPWPLAWTGGCGRCCTTLATPRWLR